MRLRTWFAFVACALAICSAPAHAEDTVKVTITITVPKDTDEKATLYLAGNLKEVGEWKADGVKLTRNDDGTYKYEGSLPRGQTLEYKINGGNWDTVEKGENGDEIQNRTLKLDDDKDEKITVQSWAKSPAAGSSSTSKSTITGDVRTFDHFKSAILDNERTILVWLPPGYEKSDARYPVLYLHDGQNCFDASTSFAGEWRADETAGELIKSGKIQPIIMVAVANSGAGRIDEYTPTRDETRGRGGKAELYARFLIQEVKPFIDAHFRSFTDRDHTAVAGSSLGGLISLYLGHKHSDVFSMCGAMSPSLWWDDQHLTKSIESDPAQIKREKIWLDIGTDESVPEESAKYVAAVDEMTKVLSGAGMVKDKDFVARTYEGAKHNEQAWAARFGDVLTFFFGNS